MASSCAAWQSTVSELRAARARRRRSRLAVCLTGQMRLFMASFPTLAHNLLLPAAREHELSFFYVGPADASYKRGAEWLSQLPGVRGTTTYAPKPHWTAAPGRPIAELRLAGGGGARNRSTAALNLHGVACGRAVPAGRLKSRALQATQRRECLRLIERDEAPQGVVPPPRAARYNAVLVARADLVVTAAIEFGAPFPALANDVSALADCPPPSDDGFTWPHDFALYGARRAMGHILGATDRLTPEELSNHSCDFGGVGAARLRAGMPDARCRAPRSRTAVGSLRGSASAAGGRCFFVDQEHPPNDGEAQPRLSALFAGAAEVATACLGLDEQRDGRRPGVGAVCQPHGGWDGDFRFGWDASPWDEGRAPNLGSG